MKLFPYLEHISVYRKYHMAKATVHIWGTVLEEASSSYLKLILMNFNGQVIQWKTIHDSGHYQFQQISKQVIIELYLRQVISLWAGVKAL